MTDWSTLAKTPITIPRRLIHSAQRNDLRQDSMPWSTFRLVTQYVCHHFLISLMEGSPCVHIKKQKYPAIQEAKAFRNECHESPNMDEKPSIVVSSSIWEWQPDLVQVLALQAQVHSTSLFLWWLFNIQRITIKHCPQYHPNKLNPPSIKYRKISSTCLRQRPSLTLL